MILVSQDSEGIYLAAMELLEHSLNDSDVERRLRSLDPDDLEQAAKLFPLHQFSPGYEDRVLYLLWLKDRMDAGIVFENILADEADGIAAIVRARGEFNGKHPPCPNCGQRLSSRGQKRCFSCHKELN